MYSVSLSPITKSQVSSTTKAGEHNDFEKEEYINYYMNNTIKFKEYVPLFEIKKEKKQKLHSDSNFELFFGRLPSVYRFNTFRNAI